MVKKGQRTGVFDLTDVDTINLNPIKLQEDKKKEPTVIMGNPQILVDETDIKQNREWG